MKFSPIENQFERPPRKLSFQYLERFDCNGRLEFTIDRMKMRRIVIVVVHPNQNPIERTDGRHPIRLSHTRTNAPSIAGRGVALL